MQTHIIRRVGLLLLAIAVLFTVAPAGRVSANGPCPDTNLPACTNGCKFCVSTQLSGSEFRRCVPVTQQCLLVCIPSDQFPGVGKCSMSAEELAGPMGGLNAYLSTGFWLWVFGTVIGIAVLNGTFAALQIATSNGDQTKVENGKTRLQWTVLGLLMLLFAGTLLHFLNPAGFAG